MCKLQKMTKLPIRTRLTLWYLIGMCALLILFGGLIRPGVDSMLLNQVDTSLELAASQALSHITEQDGQLVFQNPGELSRVFKEFTLYLLASDGTVWDSLNSDDAPAPRPLGNEFSTIDHYGFREEWRVYCHQVSLSNNGPIGWLQIAHSMEDNIKFLEGLERQILILLPFILLLAGVGGFILSSNALRPIDRITRTARAINTSDLKQRINYEGADDEVGLLATTFDSMLERLQAGFEREQRFTADAAHELRTPLTALKGSIGVTTNRPRQRAYYEEALHDMEQQVDRLVHLTEDLLLMARLDHIKRLEQSEKIALSDLLASLVEQVTSLAQEKDLTLIENICPDLSVTGSLGLLIRLFLNLLDNAIKYTPVNGQITIQAKKDAKRIIINIRDTGKGIPPEHLPYLFDRFYRSESDRARSSNQIHHAQQHGGAGLGLAIAREITQVHNGTLTVKSKIGKGSTFTVSFPLSTKK